LTNNLVSKIFDSVADIYDRFLTTATFGIIHKLQNKLIDSTPIKGNILDIGTGTGEILKKISSKSSDNLLIGIDISTKMLKKAKEKVPSANFIVADADRLPFQNKCIDNVFYSLTFRHLNQENQVNQLKEIIKKDGYVSILDLNKSKLLLFLFDKVFRPFGRLIFSKKEYEYFVKSLEEAKSINELEKLFNKNNFTTYYKDSFLFGFIIIAIFKK